MGRVTYQAMAAHWPHATGLYATVMNDIPKIVFSNTLAEASWSETRIVRGDFAAEITALKAEPGPDFIAWGGATFAAHGPIDEYSLAIQPVAVGDGQAILPDCLLPCTWTSSRREPSRVGS
jgi:dihydrofolate reductase